MSAKILMANHREQLMMLRKLIHPKDLDEQKRWEWSLPNKLPENLTGKEGRISIKCWCVLQTFSSKLCHKVLPGGTKVPLELPSVRIN